MAKRLNVLVERCASCPHVSYTPKGSPPWLCFGTFVKQGKPTAIRSDSLDTIPSWCPLPDDVSKKDVPPKDNGE